jgi:F-type H+-transporting ATPase subunit delta
MAELATIARPYAEAMFKATAGADRQALGAQLATLVALTSGPEMRQYADNPRVAPIQVFDMLADIALSQGVSFDVKVGNLLRTVIDNGRLAALPEIAAQFQFLVNAATGVSDATIQSAFAIDDAQLGEVVAALERRFARKLNARVEITPELIGGVRVVVGDEVLDTSVKARLQQMKAALIAA